jgi:hypothetical protein
MQGSPETVAYWQPDRVREYVAGSGFNFVGLLQDGQSVLKYPHRKTTETMLCLREEADRYIRLGPNPHLVTYTGFAEDGLVLEFCRKGDRSPSASPIFTIKTSYIAILTLVTSS